MSKTLEMTEGTAWSLYCATEEAPTEDHGDIIKTVLRTGSWRYSPGAGQRPIPIPLRVVAGHSTDPQKEIGMGDVIDAFKDGAIEHVTVPLSHEDNVHENTGYIRDLFVDDDPARPGQKRLRAKFQFTEPEIQKKVKNGSIANTSVGLLFNYVRKDDGKEYPIALAHVALTNHPWINGMEPFSALAASEEVNEIVHLVLADGEPPVVAVEQPDGDEGACVVWDSSSSARHIESAVTKAFQEFAGAAPDGASPYWVRDFMGSSALVTNETSGETFVVPFSVDNGVVSIPSTEQWTPAKQEWIAASEALGSKKVEKEVEKPQKTSKKPNGGNSMSDVLEGLELADNVRDQLERALKAQEEVDRLRAEARTREVDDRVEALKTLGFSEQPDLLSYVRDVFLSDTGSTALNLSQDGKGDSKLTATEILDGFIERLPKKDGKLNFGDQATNLGTSEDKPAKDADEENKKAKSERVTLAETWLYGNKEE